MNTPCAHVRCEITASVVRCPGVCPKFGRPPWVMDEVGKIDPTRSMDLFEPTAPGQLPRRSRRRPLQQPVGPHLP